MSFREYLKKHVLNQSKARLTISVFVGMSLIGIVFQNCDSSKTLRIRNPNPQTGVQVNYPNVPPPPSSTTASFFVNGQKSVTIKAEVDPVNYSWTSTNGDRADFTYTIDAPDTCGA